MNSFNSIEAVLHSHFNTEPQPERVIIKKRSNGNGWDAVWNNVVDKLKEGMSYEKSEGKKIQDNGKPDSSQ